MQRAYVKNGQVAQVIIWVTGEPRTVLGIFRSPQGFQDPEAGLSYSANVFLRPEEELVALGLLPLVSDPEPDPLQGVVTGSIFAVTAGQVNETYEVRALTDVEVATSLTSVQDGLTGRIDQMLAEKLDAGMPWNSKTLQVRPLPEPDLVYITAMGAKAQFSLIKSEPFSIQFTMADNSQMTLDAAGMAAMSDAAIAFVSGLTLKGTALKAQVRAATTVTAARAVDLDAGW